MATVTRHQKREYIIQLLYESDFHPDTSAEDIFQRAVENRELPADDFIRDTFSNIAASSAQLDTTIETYSQNWRISRLSHVTHAVLRLAVYELTHTDTPPKVIINEAVVLARTYDTEESTKFVNGILNRFCREAGYITDHD